MEVAGKRCGSGCRPRSPATSSTASGSVERPWDRCCALGVFAPPRRRCHRSYSTETRMHGSLTMRTTLFSALPAVLLTFASWGALSPSSASPGSPTSAPRTPDCCARGAECCDPPQACCFGTDCCAPGAECCDPPQACCFSTDCCAAGAECCDPPQACCAASTCCAPTKACCTPAAACCPK
jgi:hypothetical protein